MLNRSLVRDVRTNRKGKNKWHNGQRNMPSIGCSICPEHKICGGLQVSKPLFWCLDYCCGKPEICDVVCRNNAKFVDDVREVGGFDLSSVVRTEKLSRVIMPEILPLLFHGNSRSELLDIPFVALPFARMFDRRSGKARFSSREELCYAFKIDLQATIILSGTDTDPPLEGWWQIGKQNRNGVIRSLIDVGVVLATSQNYSLFVDQPRWDDLHSMKRIAIAHGEMLNAGLQSALHINGRTETDFLRWTEYLQSRPEISVLAYEFTTGTGSVGRRDLHVEWMTKLASDVDRPLHLIIRGGVELVPVLSQAFSALTFIDTSAFMKTVKRRRATLTEGGRLLWRPAPTEIGAPLDELLSENVMSVKKWIRSQFPAVKKAKLIA